VREALVPEDLACVAHGLTMMLAAAGIVPTALAGVTAGLAAQCEASAAPYAASTHILGASMLFAETYAARLRAPYAAAPARDAAEWIRSKAFPHEFDAPVGANPASALAVSRYLDDAERAVRAQFSARELAAALTAGASRAFGPGAALLGPTAVKLAACAIAAASGAWGPRVSLAHGTMLGYIAWYNPVLAESLRFCVPQ
jgi:hypothetical protein